MTRLMTEQRMIQERLDKAESFRSLGQNPYDNHFKPSIAVSDFLNLYADKSREDLVDSEEEHLLAGRIMAMRVMGKAAFYRIQDRSGQLQLFLSCEILSDVYEQLKLLDMGDFIGISGRPMRTKTGELSLQVRRFQILTKSLRPLPEKWHGLSNVEQRYRQRYLDLVVNEEARRIFQTRTQVVRGIRSFLDERGFI